MTRTSTLRAGVSGAVAIVGGILMVASGYAAKGFVLQALGLAQTDLSSFGGGIAGLALDTALSLLALMISLGGFTIILGGVALVFKHRTTGRLLIMLGGGAGFIGLAIAFGYAALRQGLAFVIQYAAYWLGLVLAVLARRFAKGI